MIDLSNVIKLTVNDDYVIIDRRPPTPARKVVIDVENHIIDFLINVGAGLAVHFIVKWWNNRK